MANGLVDYSIVKPNLAFDVMQQAEERKNRLMQQQQANELAKLQLQSGRRAEEEAMLERETYRNTPDPANLPAALRAQGLGKQAAVVSKTLAEERKAKIDQLKTTGDILSNRASRIMVNPTLENAINQVAAFGRDTGGDVTTEIQYLRQIGNDPQKIFEWSKGYAMKGHDLVTSAETARHNRATEGLTRRGQDLQYDPDLQARISQAKEYGQTLGKNKAVAEAALPSALQTAEEGIRLIDEMVGKAPVKDASGKVIQAGTKPHPGFSSYVGATLIPGQRFLEGSDTASYEVRQKQIEGKAFLEAFNALKGGGSITEKEGEKGTQAIMRMNKASNEKEYIAAARELQGILRTGMDRARAKAGQTSPTAAPATTPAAVRPGVPAGAENVIDFNTLK